MSPPKFTPGPWKWDEDGESLRQDPPGVDSFNRKTSILTSLSVGYGGETALDIFDEDRTLIAAAPDLYAALAKLHDDPYDETAQADARIALEKARGES